jgi:hypothetical protein
MEHLKDWRWINTTNGIWDTRFWIKPLDASPICGKTKIRNRLIE